MVKPDAVKHIGKIIERIQSEDFTINQMKKVNLSRFVKTFWLFKPKWRDSFYTLFLFFVRITLMECFTKNAARLTNCFLTKVCFKNPATDLTKIVKTFHKEKEKSELFQFYTSKDSFLGTFLIIWLSIGMNYII